MSHVAEIRDPFDVLISARRVANLASLEGVSAGAGVVRPRYDHLGAILADSVLQAGLNYRTVVRPRVVHILTSYPEAATANGLLSVVDAGMTSEFLRWDHIVKVHRFERLARFICANNISNSVELRARLRDDLFGQDLQELNGVGPKTVDYMACLVGIETIAVDRHIRNFAQRVGVENTEYGYLKRVFCMAADLLAVSRREFDAWVWRREAARATPQLSLEFG